MRPHRRAGIAWPELLLALAIVALVLQLLPSDAGRKSLELLDIRTWTTSTWFFANALLFASMFIIRFGPALRAAGRDFLKRSTRLQPSVETLTKEEQKRKYEEERALYERMIEARKKQII